MREISSSYVHGLGNGMNGWRKLPVSGNRQGFRFPGKFSSTGNFLVLNRQTKDMNVFCYVGREEVLVQEVEEFYLQFQLQKLFLNLYLRLGCNFPGIRSSCI